MIRVPGSQVEVKPWAFAPTAAELADEDLLADAIELDGRRRAERGLPVTVSIYLSVVADLAERPVPLDAAIDVTIRSAVAAGAGLDGAIGRIIAEHPGLARAVRECVQLNALLPTTPPGSTAAPPPGPAVGEGLGPLEDDGEPRYRVVAEMGSGSYGRVVRAVDRRLGDAETPACVAVKVLGRAVGEADRVLDEAVKARRVDHPSIVRVIDAGWDGAHGAYIVYELVTGGDLAQRLAAGRGVLPVREAVSVVAAAARGVHAAHAAGLLHMDLKPANILLTEEGTAKVADFGNALRVRGLEGAAGRNVRGTIAYLAPEQIEDPSAASTAVDIYALGGILMTALVGDVPLGYGLSGTGAREVEGRLAAFPRELRRTVARAMSPRPGDRHASAAALAEDLDAWLAARPIPWQRPGLLRRSWLAARRRPLVAALLAVMAAGAVAAGVVGWRMHDRELAARIQAREAKDRMRWLRSIFGSFLSQAPKEETTDMESSLFWETIVTDWVYGPRIIGDMDQLLAHWSRRRETARALLAELQANGHEDDFRTLVWQLTCGFWLTQDCEPAQAGPILEDNRRRWEARLRAGDPLLTRIDELLLCVRCQALWDPGEGPGKDARRDRDLREASGRLRRAAEAYLADLGPGQQHVTMLWALREAYSAGGLADPDGQAWVRSQFKRYPDLEGSHLPRVSASKPRSIWSSWGGG